jgi:hypothetical protein
MIARILFVCVHLGVIGVGVEGVGEVISAGGNAIIKDGGGDNDDYDDDGGDMCLT